VRLLFLSAAAWVPAFMVSISGYGAAFAAGPSGISYVKKENGAPGVLARIEGESISEADIEKMNPDVFKARLDYYRVQKAALDEAVRNKVLESLAKKAGLSLDEFLKKEMIGAKAKVSDKEVDEYLASRDISSSKKITPKIRDQVRGLVHARNLVSAATAKNSVDLFLNRPKAVSRAISSDAGDPSIGESNAPITIYEFMDFQCDFCAKARERVSELKKEYGKKLRVVVKHFPLSVHPFARPAAEAGMCVNEQGTDKFWKFYDIAFDNQKTLSRETMVAFAIKAGVDEKRFKECFEAKKYSAKIDASIAEARQLGIDSTPTYVVKNQILRGAQPLADFKEIIEDPGN